METLTIRDAVALATVIGFAQRSCRVRYLTADRRGHGGDLLEGTARSIGDERGNFLRGDEDVRGGFLRITLTIGMDVFMPIGEAVRLVDRGEMAAD